MFRFKRLILHNFGSYSHAEIDLSDKGFCLVSGQNNYKKDNAKSNGAGKSFIWSAICFTLTGETIQGLRTNLKNINIDEDLCYTKLVFSVDADNYEITRYIASKSDLKIIKNDIDISGKGIRESEKKLGEVLPDLSKDLIASTIIIGQGMPNRFSAFSPSGRKELLEKLTKADFMIEDIKTRVNTRQQEVAAKLREYEDSILVCSTKKSDLERQQTSLEKDLAELENVNYDLDISNATASVTRNEALISNMTGEITKYEELVDTYNNRLIELTKQKSADEQEEFTAYTNATSTILTNKSYLTAEIKALKEDIKKLSNIKDICPTCGQKIPGIIKPNTAQQEADLATKTEKLAELDTKLTEFNNRHLEYSNQIKEAYATDIAEVSRLVYENKQEATKLRTKVNELLLVNKQVVSVLTDLRVKQQTASQRITAIKTAIAACLTGITQYTNTLKLVEDSKLELGQHAAILKKMETLIKRDFRGFLLENIIQYLDTKAKDFCEIVFGTRELSIYLDGNALDISYCGKMFDNLSGGEKQRVDLILQFAIRDMLTAHLNLSANILVLDEITDFLDKQSCAAIMRLIEHELSSVESVFIVSHHADELELPIDSKLHVIKNAEGISEIV